jgi:hypothetical protein
MNRPQCKCATLKGDQCTKKTTKGPYCGIHTKKCGHDFAQKVNPNAHGPHGRFNPADKIKDLEQKLNHCMKMHEHDIDIQKYKRNSFDIELKKLSDEISKCKMEKEKMSAKNNNKGMVQLENGMFDLFEKPTPKKLTPKKLTPPNPLIKLKSEFPFSMNHHMSNFMSNRYARSSFCG